MKKFLSLVLALVMTMSLVTVSAGAKDFTDDGKITYGEAVDVISAIGVVDGYTDGSFNPDATLTRGAAAKIICNLLLGPTTASALSADAAPFKDVPTSNNFSGYIAYCSQQKIISGYNDGTFRPAATLTSYAFMKMLLGALGYDQEVEGYVGANWSVQVAKTALGIGLDDGLEGDFNGIKPVTREEAALYAFNMLQATMVEYDAKTTVDVNGATITIGGSKAEYVADENLGSKGHIDGEGSYIQFGERFFTKLVRDGGEKDAFMRPSHTWSIKGDKIGSYNDAPDAVYTKKTVEADIYSDCKLTSTNNKFDVYVDGLKASEYDSAASDTVTIHKGEEDDKIGLGNGAIIEVYKSDDKAVNGVIAIMNTYVGEVIAVEEATSKRAAYVEIGTVGDDSLQGNAYTTPAGDVALDEAYKFDTDKFEVGDIVTFNFSFKGNDSVKNVKAAEAVTGTVKSFTTDKKFDLDGTSYEYGARRSTTFGSASIGTEATVYMDANGYVLYTDEGKDNNKNYALVMNADTTSKIAGDKFEAYLLYTDGTTGVVTTKENYTSLIGSWVTFKTNSKDEVVLTKPGNSVNHVNPKLDTPTNAGMATGTATTTVTTENGDTDVTLGSASKKVNSGTIIIVKGANDKFKVYEGVKNIPTITGTNGVDAFSAYGTGTFLKFLYVDVNATADVDTGTAKTIFLVGDTDSKMIETDSDKYYVFDAVMDGKLVEDGVMLDYTDAKTKDVADDLANGVVSSYLLKSYAVDSNLYTVDKADKFNGGADKGATLTSGTVEKVSGDCIDFAGSAYYTAKDCVFFRVDAKGNLKSSTISGFRDGTVGGYYESVAYTYNSDAELTGVYWVVK